MLSVDFRDTECIGIWFVLEFGFIAVYQSLMSVLGKSVF